MASLQELLERKSALEKEIEAKRRQDKLDAIAQIKSLMTEYGLTLADLSAKSPQKSKSAGIKVAAKYRNQATGETWSGRGLQPKWLAAAIAAGRRLEDFAI